jgi:hypothetical protein
MFTFVEQMDEADLKSELNNGDCHLKLRFPLQSTNY